MRRSRGAVPFLSRWRPDCMAETAVQYEPVSVTCLTGKFTGILPFWASTARLLRPI